MVSGLSERLRPIAKWLLIRLGIWLLLAAVLTWPVVISPGSVLVGDSRIDVWNHAWGYWFVLTSLADGTLPFATELVGAPQGGTLYYIDTPGALWGLPVTALLGPAVGYNVVLLFRIALAGLSGQILAREITGKGAHTWLAGLAYATTPFLLCELANGISEVCATHWLALTLAAGARALRTARWQDFLALGILQGLTTVTTFYYGLTSAMLVGTVFLVALVVRGIRTARGVEGLPLLERSWLWTFPLTAVSAFLIALPHGLAFSASLKAEDGLIKRDLLLNDQLIRHNAVDPAVYITPGRFQSVDLLGEYGEPFIHTGYLRWSVLLLIAVGAFSNKRLRPWLALLLLSLVLGLGPYLWWDGDWVTIGNRTLSLPFDWLRQALPAVAITHPLRLSLGGQALASVLAAGGVAAVLAHLGDRLSVVGKRGVLVGAGLLIAGEGLFASAATWPLPMSDARINAAYSSFESDDDRAVLDLPAEVGTTMLTSRYFWLQTAHGRPIPYTPDVRLGSTRDLDTFQAFMKKEGLTRGMEEEPATPDEPTVRHMRQTYAAVVLHTDLEEMAGLTPGYAEMLTPVLGEPEVIDELLVWRLKAIETKALSAEAAAAEEAVRQGKASKAKAVNGENNSPQNPGGKAVSCDQGHRYFGELVAAGEGKDTMRAAMVECGAAMAEVCRKKLRNPDSTTAVLTEAVTLLEMFADPADEALIAQTRAGLPE